MYREVRSGSAPSGEILISAYLEGIYLSLNIALVHRQKTTAVARGVTNQVHILLGGKIEKDAKQKGVEKKLATDQGVSSVVERTQKIRNANSKNKLETRQPTTRDPTKRRPQISKILEKMNREVKRK